MRINNNIAALNTLRQYTANTNSTNKAMEKLSSGLKINRAGDDAAGLAISEKMRAQIRGIQQASDNSQNAISLVQTAEGALTETHSILQRMNELSVQSASDTNETIDREALDAEFQQLTSEINDIASQTKFNNKYILDGTYSGVTTSAVATGLGEGITVTVTDAAAGATLAISSSGWAASKVAVAGTNTATLTTPDAKITGAAAVASTVASGSAYNGTYYLKAEGTDFDGGMTFTLVDSQNNTVATSTTKTLTASGNNQTIDFGDYGDLTVSLATAAEADVTTMFNGTASGLTYTISGGSDAVTVPSATIGGQVVRQGDTSVTLATGVTLNLSALDSTDWASQNALNTALFGSVSGSGSVTISKSAAKTPLTIQTGANNGESLNISINSMKAADLGLVGASVLTQTNAELSIDTVTAAINKVSTQRANLGAYQNRLEHKINNLNTSAENLQSAESNIRDVDMAEEMVNFTKNNILLQAAQSMLAQANAQPQGVLQLLQ